jgi:hypothetical protein
MSPRTSPTTSTRWSPPLDHDACHIPTMEAANTIAQLHPHQRSHHHHKLGINASQRKRHHGHRKPSITPPPREPPDLLVYDQIKSPWHISTARIRQGCCLCHGIHRAPYGRGLPPPPRHLPSCRRELVANTGSSLLAPPNCRASHATMTPPLQLNPAATILVILLGCGGSYLRQ